jgi:hypothetical protein
MANFTDYQLVSTGIKRLNPTDTNCYENDYLFQQLGDLVNEKFKAWYCKEFYRLGKVKVLELASVAKSDGKQPAKLFSYLLRKS